jgi:uncharacterized membrane protein
VTFDEFDDFLAQPFRRWRVSLFEIGARILLLAFLAIVISDLLYFVTTYTNNNYFSQYSRWSQSVALLTEGWVTPFAAIAFAVIPFGLKLFEFRRLSSPGSPATLRDVVNMRWVQAAAGLLVVGSFAVAAASFDQQTLVEVQISNLISAVATSAIGLLVVVLAIRANPRPELD